jgi:hypothetical protein
MTYLHASARRGLTAADRASLADLAAAVAAAAGILTIALVDARATALAGAAVVALAGAYGAARLVSREIRRDFRAPFHHVWIAALDAFADNGLLVDGDPRLGTTEGVARAGGATVRVERHPGGAVRVRVRVGFVSTADRRRRAALIAERVVRYVALEGPPPTS